MALANIKYHHIRMDPDLFYHYRHVPMEVKTKVSGGADVGANGLLLFASTGTEVAFAQFFIPEMWADGTGIMPHINWSKTSDASGDVVFQIRHRHIRPAEVPGSFGDWTDVSSSDSTIDATQKIIDDRFPIIQVPATVFGEQIQFEIRRKHDDADDDYGADAILWAFGVHLQVQGPGEINAI